MRVASVLTSLFLVFAQSSSASATSSVSRDAQALIVLQQSLLKMGTPNDVSATGSVVTTEGSATRNGNVRIRIRGQNQTSEEFQFGGDSLDVTYSKGRALSRTPAGARKLNGPDTLASQSTIFPAPLLASMISNPDVTIENLGIETLDGSQAYHLVLIDTFRSLPDSQEFSPLTRREIWVDSSSGLVTQMSWRRYNGIGPADYSVPFVTRYADYILENGVFYPHHIDISLNGTAWANIQISSVAVNTGLTDADFQVN
jgi:hypothetical protein